MKKFLLALMGIAFMAGSAFAQQYQEVVYLKNGSIVRGVITEQVPNESLKIQTADGSVFAYLMKDVEKITKEEVVQLRASRVEGLSNRYDATYHRLSMTYSPVTLKTDAGSLDMTGLSFGWDMGIRLAKRRPLYLELGANIMYAFGSEDEGYSSETEWSWVSLNIPVAATWQFELAPAIHIAPYIGLNMRANIYGKTTQIRYSYEEKENWFDSDEGDGDRFNVGLTFGANFSFKKFVLGVGYTTDFTEITEATKVRYFAISAGLRF